MTFEAAFGEWLTNGAIFLGIVGLMVLEACVLVFHYRRTGAGVAPLDLIINFLSGIGLLLAFVAVLLKTSPSIVALLLAAALFSHVADLRRRWRPVP